MRLLRRRLLLALLEGTREGCAPLDGLIDGLRIPNEVLEALIDELASKGLVKLSNGLVEASMDQRLRLAVAAVELGADIEEVSRALGWREFEEMAAYILEENGFEVHRHLRFRADGRRWEIDLAALRRPYILCAECKRWRRGLRGSALEEMAEGQRRRVEALSGEAAELLPIEGWGAATLIPIILSLTTPPRRMIYGVPVIPILELPSFLEAFEGYLDEIWHLTLKAPPRSSRPHQMPLRVRKGG